MREPMPIGFEPPLREELGLALLGGDHADHVLVQARRDRLLLDVRDEAVLVLALDEVGRVVSNSVAMIRSWSRSARRRGFAEVGAQIGGAEARADSADRRG